MEVPDHDLVYHDKKCEEANKMPIGNGPDIEQFNREEEKRVALQIKVSEWWHDLDHDYKIELMENFYPDKSQLMDLDEMWNGLDWQDKLDIYNEAEGFEVRV